ncbi:hypothetical protein EST38_g4291 [Candolleomyces aberdarensis]|uniref:DUF5648 domain-containing protein n=1 Tax=Candolleomyces aberdarensis TaxID=2316362 RepID=A0A4Q2DRC9_9AGAR|nr:hypothetical protein EST38_g4291 [Candolleomyces aberdarensis]
MQLALFKLITAYVFIFGGSSGAAASPMEILSIDTTTTGNNGDGGTAINRPSSAHTTGTQNCGDPRQARPFYRMWNPTSTDHLYTINATEYRNPASTYGYLKDGIVGYVFAYPQPNAEALFRLWNPDSGDHFYTRSVTERNFALNSLGYKDEGVACYLYTDTPEAQSCGQPLYRLYGPEFSDHFYTGSQQERDRWIKTWNYTDEGVAGWLLPY